MNNESELSGLEVKAEGFKFRAIKARFSKNLKKIMRGE